MTFFLNNPPAEDSESQSPAVSQQAKSRPLFKQDNALPDTLAGEHISLSAYISKHLKQGDGEGDIPEAASAAAPQTAGFFPLPENKRNPSHQTGLLLNSLDIEMPSGLEQYLPSPIFRLRIAKKRLDGEILELRQRINKYERLPEKAPALQEQVILLRQRLKELERHQQQLRQQLSSNLSVVPMLYAFFQQGKGLERWINQGLEQVRQLVLTLFYGRAFLDMQADSDEMEALKELYAERLQSGQCADTELSAILNRFEQVVQRAELDARKIKPISFPMRLWQEAKGLVK